MSTTRLIGGVVVALLVLGLGAVLLLKFLETLRTDYVLRVTSPVCGTWHIHTADVSGRLEAIDGIAAVSNDDVWAVGNAQPDLSEREERPVILHWDGDHLREVPSPIPNPYAYEYEVNAVTAVSKNDVWAVGSFGYDSVRQDPLIFHWDGTRWSIVPASNITASRPIILNDVAAVSANDVWAVGSFGSIPENKKETLILHWNGEEWSQVPNPNPSENEESQLWSVAATAADNVWAVGFTGDYPESEPLSMQWNGTRWNRVPAVSLCRRINSLGNVSALAPNEIWASGSCTEELDPLARNSTIQGSVWHWAGLEWRNVPVPDTKQGETFAGIAATNSSDIWVTSSTEVRVQGKYQRISSLLRWNGTTWSKIAGPEGAYFTDIAALENDSVWAAGRLGDRRLVARFVLNPCNSP
jgi:hypothetical protein